LIGPFPSAYAISGLLPGIYKVFGRARGKSTEFYPDAVRIEDAAPVMVIEDVGLEDISFVLDDVGWGSVAGRAFNLADGGGISDIVIYAYQWGNYWEDPNLASVSTTDDGSFLLNLPAGDYYIMALYEDYIHGGNPVALYYFNSYDQFQADILTLEEGQALAGIDFPVDYSAPHNLVISGTIASELTGLGIDDVVVTAIDLDDGSVIGSAYTYNEGEFVINGLSPRSYLLMFSGPQIIPFFFSRSDSWQDADLIMLDRNFTNIRTEAITQDYGNNGLAIAGVVTSDGMPTEGARVYAYPLGQTEPVAFSWTDSYGEYTIISGLASGTYTVMCDLLGFDVQYFPMPVMIDLMTHPVASDINFELTPVATSVQDDKAALPLVEIAGNYPNPFNMETIISFYSSSAESFSGQISAFNLLGQLAGRKTIAVSPGPNKIVWDMSDFIQGVSSGVYYYKIDGATGMGRMILLK
jgi:hypothetical protein